LELCLEKGLNFDLVLDSPARKVLSVKQFLAQKLITEVEHPPCSPDLAPYDFWLFFKISSVGITLGYGLDNRGS
jgi:hypothetical protein